MCPPKKEGASAQAYRRVEAVGDAPGECYSMGGGCCLPGGRRAVGDDRAWSRAGTVHRGSLGVPEPDAGDRAVLYQNSAAR